MTESDAAEEELLYDFTNCRLQKSGKTTLMRHIVSFLKTHGYTVATIKHHGHAKEDIQLQDSDVDHMKHFEAGADQSIVQGFQYQQTVTRVDNQNLTQIIEKSVTIDTNIVLVEGFKMLILKSRSLSR